MYSNRNNISKKRKKRRSNSNNKKNNHPPPPPSSPVKNDNLPASLLQSVVQRRQTDIAPTFIRSGRQNPYGKRDANQNTLHLRQNRRGNAVFPPKRPIDGQRKNPFQNKQHPRRKNNNKRKNQKQKAGPKVIATSTYDESGQNAILDDNVINIDARDTQIPSQYHKREAVVMIENKEEADFIEKTEDGVWLKRDFPSTRPGSREEVLLLEETMEKMLKSVDDIIKAAKGESNINNNENDDNDNKSKSTKPEVDNNDDDDDDKKKKSKEEEDDDENINNNNNNSTTAAAEENKIVNKNQEQEKEEYDDDWLINYRKFPKLLETVKQKQNVYNACLLEIIRQINVGCKERAILTERIRMEQEKLFHKLSDMVLSSFECARSFDYQVKRKEETINDIQREASRMEDNNKALFDELDARIKEAVDERQFFCDQLAKKIADENFRERTALKTQLNKWKVSYKRTKRELDELKALDPDQLENEKMNRALQLHMAQLEAMMKSSGGGNLSAADKESLEKKRALELKQKLEEQERLGDEFKEQLEAAQKAAELNASALIDDSMNKQEQLSVQLSVTRDKIADMEARLKAMEISRRRLDQRASAKIEQEEARWERLQANLEQRTIDFEIRKARAQEMSAEARQKASAEGKDIESGLELELEELDQELDAFKEEIHVRLKIDQLKDKVELYNRPDNTENETMGVIENHKLNMETLNSDLQKCKDDAAKEVGLFRSKLLSKAKAVERLVREEQQKLDNLETNLTTARDLREDKLRVSKLQLDAALKEERFEIQSMRNSQQDRRQSLADETSAVRLETEIRANQAAEESDTLLKNLEKEVKRLTEEDLDLRTQIEHEKKALKTALKRADEDISNYRENLDDALELKSKIMDDIQNDKKATEERAAEEERKLEEKELELLLKRQKAERIAEELAEEVKKQEVIVEKVEEEKIVQEETKARVTEQLDTFRDSATTLSKRLSQRMSDQGQVIFKSTGFQTDITLTEKQVMYVRPEMKNKKCQKRPKFSMCRVQTPKEWMQIPETVKEPEVAVVEQVDEHVVEGKEEVKIKKKKKVVNKAPFKKVMETIRPSEMNSLLELINPDSNIKINNKPKSLEWLIQFIRDCYNALEHVLLSPTTMVNNDFFQVSDFVYDMLMQKFGVKAIVDQKLWEFAATIRLHRESNEEVKYFSDFACKLRSPTELKFMLQVRVVVKKSTIGRLIPQAIDYNQPQCINLDRAAATVKTVFNSLIIPDGMEQEIQLEKRMCLRRIHVLAQQNNKSPRLLAMQDETKKQSSRENPIDGWITLTSLLDMLAFTIRQQESRIKVHTWACIAFQIVDDNHDGFITLNQFYKVFALVEPKIVRHELRKSYERATKHTQELSLYTYCKVAMSILSPALSVGSFSHTVRQLPSHDEIRRSIQTNIYIGNRKNDHPDIADAKHILKTIATQWSSFAKLVVNYIQLLYHTDDEESIDTAKEIDNARIELHNALVGDQETDNTVAPPHDVKLALRAIHYYRKILLTVAKHQMDHQLHVILLPNKNSLAEELKMLQQSILLRWQTADDGEKGGMNRNHMQITTHDKFLLKNVPYRRYHLMEGMMMGDGNGGALF